MTALPSSCQVCRKKSLRSHIPVKIFHHVGHSSRRCCLLHFVKISVFCDVTFSAWPPSSLWNHRQLVDELHLFVVCQSSPPIHQSQGKVFGSSWNYSGLIRWPCWPDWSSFSLDLTDFIFWLNLGKSPRLIVLSSVTALPFVAVVFSTLSRWPTSSVTSSFFKMANAAVFSTL